MRRKLSTRLARGLTLLFLGGITALGLIAVPALAGTSAPAHTSTATGVTTPTAAARTSGSAALVSGAAKLGKLHGPLMRLSCVTTSTGRAANCSKRIAAAHLPRGARDKRRLQNPTGSNNLAGLVDTRTWTSGGGNTFPGAEAPFGMVQWSPDTAPTHNAGGGYDYSDTELWGYSLTHVSGPGCGAGGDVPMVPTTGALPSGDPNQIMTAFSHTNEVAQAGYYSAQSNQPNTVTSEFTATPHSSMARFTYPATTQADFLIKLMASQNGDDGDSVKVIGNNEIQGSDTSGNFCGETNNDGQSQAYTVYFDITFDQPFTASQVITNSGQSDPAAVNLTFDTTKDPTVQAKVGISYVSAANAKLNWQTENPGWNFNAVRRQTQDSWDQLLGKIQVGGGSYSQTQEFYSLLYKDFLQPNITSDVNGQFMGADLKVHSLAPGQKNQYGMYSGWDIYHSLSQLQAMLDPQSSGDMAQSQLNYYSEDKLLQQWGYNNLNNYVMVGDPTDSIIADEYTFGAHNFNTKQALSDMLAEATTVNDVRPGEALEQQLGYLPEDGTYGCCNAHGYMSTLLEYDNEDLALAQFAKDMRDTPDAAMLTRRANNWENLFDPATNLLTSRLANGQFEPGVTPTFSGTFPTDGEPYVEGDPYEYTWDVPNDYPALFSLLGGDAVVKPLLEQYLSQPNGFGMYAQLTNEFDFGEQFALNYAGDAAGTQKAVSNERNTLYLPGPSGLPNNDDLGANSSTFVWEMLGMYPENSGRGTLDFASPGFPRETIRLANGHAINISAPGASPSTYYVKSLRLNGRPYSKSWVDYSTLSRGASLDWQLGTTPTSWGSAAADAPPSYSKGLRPVVGFASEQNLTIAPGSSSTLQVGAQNATAKKQRVSVAVSAPAGADLSVSSPNTTITVPANGRTSLPVTISASASAPLGYNWVTATLTMRGGVTQTVKVAVLVAQPGSLLAATNSAGISDDTNVGQANFDGGGASYSAQALAAQGWTPGATNSVDGVSFTWPQSTPGWPDNVVAQGQNISVNAPAGTQTLAFLGSAADGPSQGLVTEHYTDGSSAQYWLGLSDWTLNGGSSQPSYGNQTAISLSYRNCSYCSPAQQTVATYVFYAAVPVDPGKTLASVTLPNGASTGTLHVFSIGTSTSPLSGPVASSVSPSTASGGQQVTINGSGFGASQGSGYVEFSDNGADWGGPGQTAVQIDSWSDSAVTFTVPASVSPGTPGSVTVVTDSGSMSDSPGLEITPTADPSDYYDSTGTSPDDNQACSNFDGVGYSYSATALAAAGLTPGATVSADGLTFKWTSGQPCSPDNILAAGQTMLVSGPAGANTLGLLENSTDGGTQGTITINYTDGTSSTATITSSDWANGPGTTETAAATMPYRNSTSGSSQQLTVYVYATTVAVDPSKTVQSITLPNVSDTTSGGATAMHIWSVSLGTT
ncbi:MAG TPA: GH92 family glycosyl hydrolase [Solirubrobacteraceae bacterium]|nr:GH92 family glycosyl hydrolase [Solirubrobacteraceae bacterium]